VFEVRVRVGKNRLYFTMSGVVSQAEAKAAADQTIQEVSRLRPGFDTISSISGLEPLEPGALAEIERINAFLVNLQRGRLIRVVGKSAQAAVQFERLSRGHGYSAQLAFSLKEAERILDGGR
jgi:hypothetical protein